MYKAGYDPQAFISFFEKLQAQEKKKPSSISKAFSTHPQTPDRITRTQEEIATILPPKSEYKVTTSEFDEVKARLPALEKKRLILRPKDGDEPSLRRTSSRDQNGSEDANDDDDRHGPLARREDENEK